MNQMHVSRRRRRPPVLLTFFMTIILLAGISLGLAYVWQNAENAIAVDKPRSSSSAVFEEPLEDTEPPPENVEPPPPPEQTLEEEFESPYMASASPSQSQPEKIKTASEAAADASARSGGDATDDAAKSGGYARDAVESSVPLSGAVDYKYFDDAIFFGDSISTGIPLYMQTLVPNAAVIASQGVSPEGANTSECISVNGTRMTMLDAAKTKGERGKVYIMLGANALDMDETSFIKGYTTFVQSIKSTYPSADVYVQSMLPVTSAVNKTYPSKNINNTRISTYNDSIRKMAVEQGVWYVDVAQCMVTSDGFLPNDASPFDGMHLTPEYYIKWFDYLRTHTVSDKTNKGNDSK